MTDLFNDAADGRAVYLGIDPGAGGGLCLLSPGAPPLVVSMPETDQDIWEWFRTVVSGNAGGVHAVVEQVGGYIQGNKSPGSAMFNFGAGFGKLLMALTAAGIPHELTPPQRWQKGLGIPGRKRTESKTEWKRRLKQHAQRLYPGVTITNNTADAILIATYCLRKQTGTLETSMSESGKQKGGK